MEEIGPGPVEDGHEVVADDLDSELAQIQDTLPVVLDEGVSGGKADLDIVMDVDGFHHLGVKAIGMDLIHDFPDFVFFPDFAGHLVVQGPDDACHAGDLFNVGQGNGVVSFPVPAPSHFHCHTVTSLHYFLDF